MPLKLIKCKEELQLVADFNGNGDIVVTTGILNNDRIAIIFQSIKNDDYGIGEQVKNEDIQKGRKMIICFENKKSLTVMKKAIECCESAFEKTIQREG